MPKVNTRKFFETNTIRHQRATLFRSFDILRSYAPGGFLRSGKDHVRISVNGSLEIVTMAQEHRMVESALGLPGVYDSSDPGYDRR